MSRPKAFNRAEAVEAAMNAIWKHGMRASSVKALSEQLGITRSSFYNAFGNLESLLKETLSLYFRRSPDRVLSDIGPDDEVLKVITAMFREVCRVRAADPDAKGCMAVNCAAELVGVDEVLGPILENALLRNLDLMEGLLRQAVEKGEIENAGDIREKALAIQNLLVGLNLMSKIVRSEADLWAVARQTLNGLGLYKS